MVLSPLHVDTIIRRALKEDIGGGDVTTSLFVGPRDKARAELIVKEAGVVCGLLFFCRVFRLLDPRVRTVLCVRDGMYVKAGTVAAVVTGSAGAILRGERTALNIVQRLSGIASMTRRYVEESGGRIKILDTRKTTPGLRLLEKYAVKTGGGMNHRMGLYDMVLIKDNHIAVYRRATGLAKGPAIAAMVAAAGGRDRNRRPVEVEVDDFDQACRAYDAGADIIMFDNARPGDVGKFDRWRRGRKRKVTVEWSGSVTIGNIRSLKGLPVDWISVGALTHSAPSLDFSLKFTVPCAS